MKSSEKEGLRGARAGIRGRSNLALLILLFMAMTTVLIDGCTAGKKHSPLSPLHSPVQVKYRLERCKALNGYAPGSLLCDGVKIIPLTLQAN